MSKEVGFPCCCGDWRVGRRGPSRGARIRRERLSCRLAGARAASAWKQRRKISRMRAEKPSFCRRTSPTPKRLKLPPIKWSRSLGPIDVWVNDAMTTIFAPFHQITAAEFKRATEVTYLGTVYGTMSAMKRMRTRNRGAIVQVGSALAYRSIPLQSPYCGAKHAIAGFTDSIRSELIHQKSDIHITMVQLPAMNTPQFSWCRTRLPRHPQPVPPIFQPEVAARAIVWASSHRRREIYVGWPTVKAIYGKSWRRAMPTNIWRSLRIAARRQTSRYRRTGRTICSNPQPNNTRRTEFLTTGQPTSAR